MAITITSGGQVRVLSSPGQKTVTVVKKTAPTTVQHMQNALSAEVNPEELISTDADNSITKGIDERLYVRDGLPTDPLAYYILAKG